MKENKQLIIFISLIVIILIRLRKCTKYPFIQGTKKLKTKTKYKSGKHRYIYKTDKLGRIVKVKARRLKFGKPEESWNKNTPGKRSKDHAGHLIGNRFGGSNDIDNLVSMKESINLGTFKILENKWAKALNEKKRVSVWIRIKYTKNSKRPNKFEVKYKINSKVEKAEIKN